MSRLTPNAAADLCRISRATILRAIASNALSAEKIGGQWAIAPEALERWASLRPQRAHRRPVEARRGPEAPEPAQTPQNAPESATEASSGDFEGSSRIEALEALCAALSASVEALQLEVSRLTLAQPQQAPTPEPDEPTPAKRRIWPF